MDSPYCWIAGKGQQNTISWIQVCMSNPKTWIALILQGRKDADCWVKSIKISYTRNGKEWKFI